MANSSGGPASSDRPTGREHHKKLNREKIAEAAIALVRESGLDRLSMRQVAARLGVDVAALYRHFKNKAELLGEVGAIASEHARLQEVPPSAGLWDERFLLLCAQIRQRLVSHPELGLYGGGSALAVPFIARANALLAQLFHELGLRGQELVYAAQGVLHSITALAQSEVMTRSEPEDANRRFSKAILEQLPSELREAWPRLPDARNPMPDFDAIFDFAMRDFVVAAQARKRPEGQREES